jgi:NADH:ubiquinone oxidoreductase subunit 6 (subunit J)
VPAEGTTREIGQFLLTDYLLPFEFASVLLLVALVGAARLARGGRS